jgi:hypothetical protein
MDAYINAVSLAPLQDLLIPSGPLKGRFVSQLTTDELKKLAGSKAQAEGAKLCIATAKARLAITELAAAGPRILGQRVAQPRHPEVQGDVPAACTVLAIPRRAAPTALHDKPAATDPRNLKSSWKLWFVAALILFAFLALVQATLWAGWCGFCFSASWS